MLMIKYAVFVFVLLHSYAREIKISGESECETIGGDKCVFPFSYQKRTYYACTADDSDNGAPWCAVQVRSDERRTVLRGKWEDCTPQCPGYDLSDAFCRNDSMCDTKISKSYCDLFTGECHCPDHLPLQLKSRCRKGVQIGGLCDYDLECNHIDNLTQCVDHKCECQQDFLVSKTNSCIAAKKLTHQEGDNFSTLSYILLLIPTSVLFVLVILGCRLGAILYLDMKVSREKAVNEDEKSSKGTTNEVKTGSTHAELQIHKSISSLEIQKPRKSIRKDTKGLYFEEYLV